MELGFIFALFWIAFATLFNEVKTRSLGWETKYDVNTLQKSVEYLKKYGYLSTEVNIKNIAEKDLQNLRNAVKSFQAEAQLPVNGDLDEVTREMMSVPRCGNKARQEQHVEQRDKRFVIFGTKLANTNVTYSILANNYTTDLREDLVDDIFEKALGYWSDAANLNFIRSSNAVIRIAFSEGSHNDGPSNTFDGKGKTLAHGFFPGIETVDLASDVHFDDAEDWTYNSEEGVALLQVATHEIGHALGLRHSNVRQAVMSAFYPGLQMNFSLHEDDITGIQMLYGSKRRQGNRLRKLSSLSTCAANYCHCGHVTAITKTLEENTFYAFYQNYVYKLRNNHVVQGYPKLTSSEFPEFSGHVDAAHTFSMGENRARIYLFKDNVAYMYQINSRGTVSYIKHGSISNIVYGVTGNVTSILQYGENRRVYLFTGNKYYRLTKYGDNLYADWHYPKSMSHWRFPSSESPDAALMADDGKIYFFFGDDYYQYDERYWEIIYPSSDVKKQWFGCSNGRLIQSENLVHGNQEGSPPSQNAKELSSNKSNYIGVDICVIMCAIVLNIHATKIS